MKAGIVQQKQTAWSGYNVAQIVLTYLSRPVSTIVTVKYAENVPFPAVTICNLNQIRLSEYSSFSDNLNFSATSSTGDGKSFDQNNTDAEADFTLFREDPATLFATSLRPFLDQKSPRERFRMGHQISRMLIYCSYQGQSCSGMNFTHLWNHVYGNCFTFNKNAHVQSVSKPGPAYGLSLLLNVESNDYVEFTDTVGFRVVVHPQDDMPFPEDEGIVVGPGFATSVSIRRFEVERTAAPYGRCYDYSEEENRKVNMYANFYDVGYSDKACQRSCYQSQTILKCSCCDLDYPCINGQGRITYCNMSNPKQRRCVELVLHAFESGAIDCRAICLPSCQETYYETEVSMGQWPSAAATSRLTTEFKNMPRMFFGPEGFTQHFIRQNVAKVDIFFKQLNYENLHTVPAYDWSRLLSDVGGQLGLWMGFSLLTAVEILTLLARVFMYLLLKVPKVRRGTKVVVELTRLPPHRRVCF